MKTSDPYLRFTAFISFYNSDSGLKVTRVSKQYKTMKAAQKLMDKLNLEGCSGLAASHCKIISHDVSCDRLQLETEMLQDGWHADEFIWI